MEPQEVRAIPGEATLPAILIQEATQAELPIIETAVTVDLLQHVALAQQTEAWQRVVKATVARQIRATTIAVEAAIRQVVRLEIVVEAAILPAVHLAVAAVALTRQAEVRVVQVAIQEVVQAGAHVAQVQALVHHEAVGHREAEEDDKHLIYLP